ncbi:hypothetical protein [Aliterella atlantica]|uniref:hypothetical protein n=1 Tax=Aliterella atlantica TaxID=1827278 RepID=UPI0005D42D5C|nr:hypothetical protein [Aliterella atlantica]
MKRVINWLQSINLRQIFTIFMVVAAIFFSTVDIHGNQLQAQAEPVTPEATEYNANGVKNNAEIKAERIKENAEKSAKLLADEGKQVRSRAAEANDKNIFEAVKEKLNLDEPIDPGTKLAGEQLKEAAEDVVKAPQKALEKAVK